MGLSCSRLPFSFGKTRGFYCTSMTGCLTKHVSPLDKTILAEIAEVLTHAPSRPSADSSKEFLLRAPERLGFSGHTRTAGIWREGDRPNAFPFWFRGGGEERGARRENCKGKGEEVFVRALWRSIRVELNCQLMRFPNHVLPFKSRPPTDLIPTQQQGRKRPSASLRAREFPEQVQEGWESFLRAQL